MQEGTTNKTSIALFHDIVYALRMVWSAAPRWNIINIILVLLQGLLPLLALFLMKNIIDTATAGITSGNSTTSIRHLVIWVALALTVALVLLICRSITTLVNEAQSQLVLEKFSGLIHAKSIELDLKFYENPQDYNLMNRAQQDALTRPQAVYATVVQIIQNSISVLGIFGLLISYNWVLTLVIALIASPGALIGLVYGRKMHSLLKMQTEDERRCYYYNLMLTDVYPAKELRIFQLGPMFADLFQRIRRKIRNERLKLFRNRALLDFFAQGIATTSIFAALGYIGISTIQRVITVGAMVMYYQAFQTGFGNLQGLLRSVTSLYEHSLFLEHIYQFLNYQPTIVAIPPEQGVPAESNIGIRFEKVNFCYPGSETPTLSDINIELPPGKVIALVGANGSGKTTLIKLLCRLYDPTTGRITIENTDIRHILPDNWRRQLSVVFQDYLRCLASVYDNIRMGDMTRTPTIDEVRVAAQAAGIDEKINRLPQGYDTMLGKMFSGGEELSGGEWQKIAIARAFMRQANIIVLDEPSSALDPLAEAELFTQFRMLIKGKSAVIISHRFSTVQMADYIYVMEQGQIIERGTHQELLRIEGTYAHLYHTQARHYQQTAEERTA
ncbi:MAG: ABC transporter ATP-binding protein [bacterium]